MGRSVSYLAYIHGEKKGRSSHFLMRMPPLRCQSAGFLCVFPHHRCVYWIIDLNFVLQVGLKVRNEIVLARAAFHDIANHASDA
jgi:hypothetical protein